MKNTRNVDAYLNAGYIYIYILYHEQEEINNINQRRVEFGYNQQTFYTKPFYICHGQYMYIHRNKSHFKAKFVSYEQSFINGCLHAEDTIVIVDN